MKMKWLAAAAGVVLVGSGALMAFDARARARAGEAWKRLSSSHAREGEPRRAPAPWPPPDRTPWDGLVTVSHEQQHVIGLGTALVEEQKQPTVLRLAGATDYDPATLTVVRTMFDSRVDKVLVDLGTVVKKGDPLFQLYSNTLAEAKSAYETTFSQWTRDKKVLDYKAPLAREGSLPRKDLIEVENDEAQSRLAMKLAKDKLLVFGLSEKEIEAARTEDGVQKARMTLRSVADGAVIKRGVVPGNYYSTADELMTIAPLDHLWVRGSVSELDADKVRLGQGLKIIFPYADQTLQGKVEYIDKAIDPDTRAARFRTSIPNREGGFKAGMFVRVLLEIPPVPGRTVIPRTAMVSVDRLDYVFVKRTGTTDRYERRPIIVAKESNDQVIVAEPTKDHAGLRPGEEVVTNGSLILEQMYEDLLVTEAGVTL
ncbi:MAG: rane fusion protein heavy metal efflux system [Chloroflexota bacterium]|nr:rane fusion protein heavy metal efflux system [Chloroflexota bacterium]